MSLVQYEHGNAIAEPELPAGARPLGVKVRPIIRLALGYRDEQRNGAPVKSDHFIARSESAAALARFADKYGDKPKSVRIMFPAALGDALDIRYVAFKGAPGAEGGGNLVAIGQTNFALNDYRGGPDTVTVWNQDGTVDELEVDGPEDPQLGDVTLELRTRLRFGIPDVLGFGSFAEVTTGGAESTDNLWTKARELYAIFGSRVTVAVEPLLVLKPSTMRAPKFEGKGRNQKQVGWQKASLFVVDIVVPESIEEMLTRLRDRQQVLAPNGAVAVIYGPERPALPQAPGAGAGRQTQAAAPAAPGSSLPPDPAPPSDEPPLNGEIVEEDDLARLSAVVVPDGAMAQGLTLEQVAGNEGGRDWLVWAAGDDSFTDEFREQVTRFLELRAS